MKITLKDGSFKEYEGSMSVLDIQKISAKVWQMLLVRVCGMSA